MKSKLNALWRTATALFLAAGAALVAVTPAPVLAGSLLTLTLSVPDTTYQGASFTAISTVANQDGAEYTNVRFNITVTGPQPFSDNTSRQDIFTITQVNGSADTQGINDTFVLDDGVFVGYWGPEQGFPMSANYSATSNFTVQMANTAPQGTYVVRTDLVDLSNSGSVLATATDGFSVGPEHSTYKFVYNVPQTITVYDNATVDMTFSTDVLGGAGYDGVRFHFAKNGPGDVTFTATDSQGHEITQTNEGYWGPAEGFSLPAQYTATTRWTLNFDRAGSYSISFSLVDASTGEVVAGIQGAQAVEVERRVLTVTGITAISKPYDGNTDATLNTEDAALEGVVNDDNVTLNVAQATGAFADKNVGSAKIVTVSGLILEGDDAANYAFTEPTTTADITALPITVTGISADDKVYDGTTAATLNTSGYQLQGVVSGDQVTLDVSSYTASFESAGVGTGIPVTVSGLALSGTDAGNYGLTQPTGLSANIAARGLTVTADDKTITYGQDDPEFTATIVGFADGEDASDLAGTLSFTREDADNHSAGTYSITPSGLTSTNYEITFVEGTLTISPKKITVTADSGQTKVYGEDDPVFAYRITVGELVGSDELSGALSRETGEDVGTYAITQGTLDNPNYDITFVSADFTITARPITVTADSGQIRVYGEGDPVFTYTTNETLIQGDSFSGALSRETGEDVGTYAITQGTLDNPNYDITFVSADFTITARPITVTADAKTKVYGASDPELTYSANETLIQGDSFSGALTRAPGENVGTYAINQGTLTLGDNYEITFVPADFSITRKPITVTAKAASKTAGDPDPAFEYSVNEGGLVGSDTLSGALTREDAGGNATGEFHILQGTVTNQNNPNYNITFVGALFTVNPSTAAKLAFTTQPGSAVADLAFGVQPVVEVQDQYGNRVDSGADIRLEIKSGTGAPGAELVGYSATAVHGVATFTDAMITTAYSAYVLTATSDGLASVDSQPFDVVPPDQVTTYDLPLNPGWNLISLPLIPVDSSVESVLDGVLESVEIVWSYDASTGEWSSWAPAAQSNTLSKMVDGKAYWVKLSNEFQGGGKITFTGSPMPIDGRSVPPSYAVFEGWNLVGFKSIYSSDVGHYLTGTSYRLPIYFYSFGSYYSLKTDSYMFQPGLGYWIFFNADGTVTPSDHPIG